MGSFLGHVLPGLYFLVLGAWGSFNCSRNFSISRWGKQIFAKIFSICEIGTLSECFGKSILPTRKSEAGYRNKATHQGSLRLPCESLLKLAAFSVQLVFLSSLSLILVITIMIYCLLCESLLKLTAFSVQLVFLLSLSFILVSIFTSTLNMISLFPSGWRAGHWLDPQRHVEQLEPLGHDHLLHGQHPLRNWILL